MEREGPSRGWVGNADTGDIRDLLICDISYIYRGWGDKDADSLMVPEIKQVQLVNGMMIPILFDSYWSLL